jgi:hypothetical protein
MWCLVDEVSCINTNHLDTKTLSSRNTQLAVFLNVVHIHSLPLVNGSLIDTFWIDLSEELTESNTIIKYMEKSIILNIHWDSVCKICIIL